MKIELSETQVTTIMNGLSMLPYRDSAQLIAYLHIKTKPPVTDASKDESIEIKAV